MDKSIDGRAGAAVLQSHPPLQLGQEGLEDGSFPQQQLVQQEQKVVLPIAPNAGE